LKKINRQPKLDKKKKQNSKEKRRRKNMKKPGLSNFTKTPFTTQIWSLLLKLRNNLSQNREMKMKAPTDSHKNYKTTELN